MLSQGREEQSEAEALDAAFERYVERVDEYSRDWWSYDCEPQRGRLCRSPGLRGEVESGIAVSTRRVYRDSSGWDLVRLKWQSDLIEEFRPPGLVDMASGRALCFLTLGLPGSGKTQVLRRVARRYVEDELGSCDGFVHDPDAVRVRFPEYRDGLGSAIVQEELQRLCYDEPTDPLDAGGPGILSGALERALPGSALIIDTVGSATYGPEIVSRARRLGWGVYLLVTSLSLGEAVRRAKVRAVTSGRLVEPRFIERSVDRPEACLRACLRTGDVEGYAVIDTSLPTGRRPLVLEGDPASTFGQSGESIAYW